MNLMNRTKRAILLALFAAVLYAVSIPFSKLLLPFLSPTMSAAFLYLGAGIGMGILMLVKRFAGIKTSAPPLEKKDLPYTITMVMLDIAAPIFLMYGISLTNAASVSLLNNFEIVATALIARVFFGERISGRLWIAIGLVSAGGMLLTLEAGKTLSFDVGALFVLAACLCWGIENNCTRSISDKNAEEIVLIKGIFSGLGSLATAWILGESLPALPYLCAALVLGFVSYGLSIQFYVTAQNTLGAAKTGAFYSISPFVGVGLGFLLFQKMPTPQFFIALAVMIAATVLMTKDSLKQEKE